jgi:hypothetical protein
MGVLLHVARAVRAFLLGLHWYEKDARERKKNESLRPVPTS